LVSSGDLLGDRLYTSFIMRDLTYIMGGFNILSVIGYIYSGDWVYI